jgi:hypothetical protein
MILAAFDPRLGWGFVNPAFEKAQLYWISQPTFKKQWNRYFNILVEAKYA